MSRGFDGFSAVAGAAYDFNNVSRPVLVTESSLSISVVTGLISTLTFINPTLIGPMPGYYTVSNSTGNAQSPPRMAGCDPVPA